MKINLSETNQRQLPFIAIVPFLLITFGLAWGSSGVGFYYAGDTPAYHTLQDNVTEIDRRSIQHNGSYALSLLKHFGNLDLKTLTATQNAEY
jgi:ABC-type nitrate/sulfonate/bicarbonate transport system permease component